MKLFSVQLLADAAVDDPRQTSAVRSFYTTKDGYDIDYDPQNSLVKITFGANHIGVPWAMVRGFKFPANANEVGAPALTRVPVMTGAGTYVLKPKETVVDVAPYKADAMAAVEPPKRKRGRPPKVKTDLIRSVLP